MLHIMQEGRALKIVRDRLDRIKCVHSFNQVVHVPCSYAARKNRRSEQSY